MYNVEAIILRRHDYRPSKSVLTLFSRDFGRFDCFYTPSKLSPKIDTWALMRGTITTKQGKNSLGTITAFDHISTTDWDYMTYEFFLWFISASYRLLPEWNAYVQLFDDLKKLYHDEPSRIESVCRITYLTLRLLVIFGIHQVVEDSGLTDVMSRVRHANYEDIKDDIVLLDHQLIRAYAQNCCDHFFSQA